MSLSVRNLRLLVMGTWSGFLIWLWLSDNVLRYLGPHTVWVVSFGAIALSISTVAYAWLSLGSPETHASVSWTRAAGMAAMLLPIAVGITMANASLGALAASNKLSSRGVDTAELARSLASDSSEVSFLQIDGAGKDKELSGTLGLHAGSQVALTGLVMEASTTATGRFDLGRFYISCCVADALPVSVTIDPKLVGGGPFEEDQWYTVKGTLIDKAGGGYEVEAGLIEAIPEPQHPYLSFGG
jgi:putative membrane protein